MVDADAFFSYLNSITIYGGRITTIVAINFTQNSISAKKAALPVYSVYKLFWQKWNFG